MGTMGTPQKLVVCRCVSFSIGVYFQVPAGWFRGFKVDLLPMESEKAQWMLDVAWFSSLEKLMKLAGERAGEEIRRLGGDGDDYTLL